MVNSKNLRVLMLTSSYPIKGSNLGPFIRNLVKGITKEGVKVGVLVYSTADKFKVYEKDGATIYEYPYSMWGKPCLHKGKGLIPSVKRSFVAKIQFISYLFASYNFLKKISRKYDIIHAHWMLPAGFIASVAKKKIGKPLITTAWGADLHLPPNPIIKKLLLFVEKKSNIIVAVSKYMVSQSKKYDLDYTKFKVISNCTDLSKFQPLKIKNDRFIIGTARRLVPEKRIIDLIKAFAKLDIDNSQLWIVGDGPLKKQLQKECERLSISTQVVFKGMVEHHLMPRVYSKMDVFVNPSTQEGMATANLEAMASGCVAVATYGFGNDEVITNGKNGYLYESGNVAELSRLLQKIYGNRIGLSKLKAAARKRAMEFSIKRAAREYIETYEQFLL